MQIALPGMSVAATLVLDSENPRNEEQFVAFCEANRDLKIERTPRGEIVIVPPAGGESCYRNADAISQLFAWARKTKIGRSFGSTALFLLSDGSALSPDAAWVSLERLSGLTTQQRKRFMPVCPQFVIEILSPSDRLSAAQQKMRTWISNGVQLGWLIDGDSMRVFVYRQSGEVQIVTGNHVESEGPVAGFTLELDGIWEGI